MTRARRWLLLAAFASCGLIAAIVVWRHALLQASANWLDVGETPRKSDYALILAGGVGSRPLAGAALVEAGLADRILLTRGVRASRSPREPTQEEVAHRALAAGGVDRDKVTVLEGKVHTTADEAAALAKFLASHPESTVTVVTSTYHSRRTRFVFETAVGSEKSGQLRFVTVPPESFNAANWWRSEVGFTNYSMESFKLLAYWFLYGNAAAWAVAFAGAAAGAGWLFWRSRPKSARPL